MTNRDDAFVTHKDNVKRKFLFEQIFNVEDELLGERFGLMLSMETSEEEPEEKDNFLGKKSKNGGDKKVLKRRKSIKRKKNTGYF